MGAVRRVDVDQDRRRPWRWRTGPASTPRSWAPRCRPGRPSSSPAGDQAAGELVDVAVELGPGPASPARDLDERLAVGVLGDGAVEVGADRLLEQRRLELSRGIGLHAPNVRLSAKKKGAHHLVLHAVGVRRGVGEGERDLVERRRWGMGDVLRLAEDDREDDQPPISSTRPALSRIWVSSMLPCTKIGPPSDSLEWRRRREAKRARWRWPTGGR